jgi:serine/threonine-protein kinase PpkA
MPVTMALLALLTGLWIGIPDGHAQARQPLLMDGKKTLFQRVVVHPGAKLHAAADATSPVTEAAVRSFTVFYVYQRLSFQQEEWLEVGPSSDGQTKGWLDAKQASDWKQALTLEFTERVGRNPVPFFKERPALERALGAASQTDMDNLLNESRRYLAGGARAPDSFPLAAVEPTATAVPRDRFYLMPIFQAVEPFEGVKALEVASIDPGAKAAENRAITDQPLRTGIVYVVDTTISMGPYVSRAIQATRKVYDRMEQAKVSDKVAFGFAAFRNSTERTPGLGYVAKKVVELTDGRKRQDFERAVAGVEESKVSSHAFDEDAFAGLETAIKEFDWKSYQGRIAVLITDAGALGADDAASKTRMNEDQIADLARANGVVLFVLHVRSDGAKRARNVEKAEQQYRRLTRLNDAALGDLYQGFDGQDLAGFERAVEALGSSMIQVARNVAEGKDPAGKPKPATGGAAKPEDEVARKAAAIGYAVQLDYLGQRAHTEAPQVVRSWVADMDIAQPRTAAFRISVLLSKQQLSDLQRTLKDLVDSAERVKKTGSRDLFQGILSAAAQFTRDPAQFSRQPGQRLGQTGLLEMLEGLPYRSAVMNLTEDDYYRMSVGEQTSFINTVKSKIERYAAYHDDVANWESFGASNPGDAVYRVPLSQLP